MVARRQDARNEWQGNEKEVTGLTKRHCINCGLLLRLSRDEMNEAMVWVHDATIGEVIRAAQQAGVPVVHGVLRKRLKEVARS